MSVERLRETYLTPRGLDTATYPLSPIDIYAFSEETYLTWPLLFDYSLDAERLVTALEQLALVYPHIAGRVCPDPDVRYVVKVTPQDDAKFGFPFVEQRSDLSLAEAILYHGQIQAPTANYPVWPDVPFFMESLDTKALIKGETALARVKLTHFRDGCALNITISHILVDGQRCIELYRDLSRAYRGIAIPPRDHDRNRLWPDRLAEHYPFLGEAVAKLPHTVASEHENVQFVTSPEESSYMEAFCFSQATLDRMKALVAPFLSEGTFVSTNDVLTAFLWMLMCEVAADRAHVTKGADLDVANTLAGLTAEFGMNGIDVIPENYFGNGFAAVVFSNHELDLSGAPLAEVLAQLAILIRQNVTQLRNVPLVAAQSILMYYSIVHEGKFPVSFERYRSSLTNLIKTPVQDVDFGKGPPRMAHVVTPLPMVGVMSSAIQAFGTDSGLMVHLQLTEKQRTRLKTSSVMKDCAAGVKRLFSDFSLAEVETFIHGRNPS